jgi:DNA-binding NarL/FixJ family response regulator
MKTLLVDDHGLFVEGLYNLLEAGGYKIVGTAYDGLEGLELARLLHPDLVLMDIRMPTMNGLEATRLIHTELPEIKIVMLTTSAEEADLFEALKNGASGYLLKTLKPNALFDYLDGLVRGEAPLSRELSARLLHEFTHLAQKLEEQQGANEAATAAPVNGIGDHLMQEQNSGLTTRQREILEMVAGGMTYKEVGVALHLSENTVKYHMGEVLRRLHAKNREQVVAHALRTGLVRIPKETSKG